LDVEKLDIYALCNPCIPGLLFTYLNNKNNMDSLKNKPVHLKNDSSKVVLPDEEWKKILLPAVYCIARQKGTQRPWSSKFEDSKAIGTYYCAACGNDLFKSDTKFESACGWPSFYKPIGKASIIYTPIIPMAWIAPKCNAKR